MADHPPLGLVDVFAATIPTLAFKPGVHVNYAETVLPMKDGLPKLKDFPAEFGGSGESRSRSSDGAIAKNRQRRSASPIGLAAFFATTWRTSRCARPIARGASGHAGAGNRHRRAGYTGTSTQHERTDNPKARNAVRIKPLRRPLRGTSVRVSD